MLLSVELEGVEMGDRGKQDEYRRGLTFDDDTYQTPDPLIHGPFTQFFCPIGLCLMEIK